MDQGTTLLALQDLELEIRRAQKQLDEMPEKRAILETRAKRQQIEGLGAKAQELVDRLQREVQKNEDESTSLTEKIDSEHQRAMSGDITNAKEIQHLTREIDALKRRREKLEMEQLQLMERVDKAKGQTAKVDLALGQIDAKEKELSDAFMAKGGELQTKVEQLTKEAAKTRKALPGELHAQYETLRNSKGGVGAGLLMSAACTACRMELPAQKVEELQAGPDLATCPNCHRILIVRCDREDD